MKILVIDNYDSFTYNLVEILRQNFPDLVIQVERNDQITANECEEYDKILISPGPGLPEGAGIVKKVIQKLGSKVNILGICLGHQAIAEIFGSSLYNLSPVRHGVSTQIKIIDPTDVVFRNLPSKFSAGLYHSWAVNPESLNGNLVVTAIDSDGEIMGIKHKKFKVRGLQFHPESILTEYGNEILTNWVEEL